MNFVKPLLGAAIAISASLAGLGLVSEVKAEVRNYRSRAPINYGSSIPGIKKNDVFNFSLSIDDSILDIES